MTISQQPTPFWHSRGYLPHFEDASLIQHVTCHLADSLPAEAVAQIQLELQNTPSDQQDIERRKRIEAWIDAGHGSCAMQQSAVAEMVQGSLLSFDGERYRLLAWVVMPNHIHVLFQPLGAWTVAKIAGSWKSFTGRRISEFMKSQAGAWRSQGETRIWHREYWDRYMRNEEHYWTTISYIHENPVKAHLVAKAEDWPWGSARLAGPGIATLQRGSLDRD